MFVNSPGGTTTGGEALYEASARASAEKKPVVAQFGTMAASAGYIVGLAHRPHRRARQHDHRLGRRHLPVAGGLRACSTSSASR
ncbi:MAG: ATP-dependent Clp protease proteolytic subunit [Burkholderiaceae bacterium]